MNIRVHIERLIIDGLNIGLGQGDIVKKAVEVHLCRFLSEGGATSVLQTGGAIPRIRTDSIDFSEHDNPSRLGQKIARSVYSGIGEKG